MSYKPLEIETLEVAGIIPSMMAMRLPKSSHGDSFYFGPEDIEVGEDDAKLAGNLIRAGNDHAKAMRGIIVWAQLTFQVGWMIEYVTYRIGVENLSTSSAMHGELKHMKGVELIEKKQADLPGKVYKRIDHFSYQALRGIYYARRNHRHEDWKLFCAWIESLPYATELIIAAKPERKNGE